MNSRITRILILLIAWSQFSHCAMAQSQKSLSEQILEGWKRTRVAEGLIGTRQAVFQLVATKNGKIDEDMSRDVTYMIKTNGTCRKVESSRSVICVNDHYTFSLRRGEAGRPWLLDKVFLARGGPKEEGLIQLLLAHDFHQVIFPSTEIWPSVSHYDALCQGRLALTDVGGAPDGLRKIAFTLVYQHPAAESVTYESLQARLRNRKVPPTELAKMWENLQRKQSVSGTMLLDPAHDWRPAQVELRSPDGVSVTTLTYTKQSGFPCQEVTREDTSPTTHSSLKVIYTPVSDKAEPAEFYLTHYDLPEPVGVVAPKSTRWWRSLWLIGVAIGFGVLAVVFRRLSRRRLPVQPS